MENLLRLYRLPYDERFPVVCFDERPCFLIGDVIKGLDLKPEQVRKQHYEYAKNGCCNLLLAVEPLTGKRYRRSRFSILARKVASIVPIHQVFTRCGLSFF